MESAKPSVYTSGNAEGIDRVRKEDGAYRNPYVCPASESWGGLLSSTTSTCRTFGIPRTDICFEKYVWI